MATFTYTSPLDNTTTAGFRAWGKELSDAFISAGAIRTADTGQVDWDTVTRPAPGTTAEASVPYDVFRLPSASSPLYFKVGYTTPSASFYNFNGYIYIQVGTSSNGAGMITGQTTARTVVTSFLTDGGNGNNPGSKTVTTSAPTYLCVTEDYVGLLFKDGLTPSGNIPPPTNPAPSEQGYFFCMRSVNSTGAMTTEGFTFHYCNQKYLNLAGSIVTNATIAVRTASPTITYPTIVNGISFIPQSYRPSTDAAGNIQLYPWWNSLPNSTPSNQCCSYVTADIAKYTVFNATIVGNRQRTYMALGSTTLSGGNAAAPLTVGCASGSAVFSEVYPTLWANAMLWE